MLRIFLKTFRNVNHDVLYRTSIHKIQISSYRGKLISNTK